VNRCVERGGVMLVAAFAIGRSQQLIYLMQLLKKQRRIPNVPIYLDSPMAVDATNVYREFDEDHDLTEGELDPQDPLFGGDHVYMCRKTEESKALNRHAGPAMIISSSGMMTGGRILHHLKQRLPDKRNTVIVGGFQAIGTRGRMLQDGVKFLKIHGEEVPVRAAVETIPGLSGHADRSGLLRWLSPLPNPKRVFLTHGEIDSAQALRDELISSRGWDVRIPAMGESQELV
jgi:metallo-beta-lactamase family protein